MLFNSLHFLVFFPIVFFLYFMVPARWQQVLLLAASVYFYMAWKPLYIFIILGTVTVDYLAALQIEKCVDARRRTLFLVASLCVNLGILFLFKYFNFFVSTANDLSGLIGAGPSFAFNHLILPLGISFHTFQAMGYVIDVYLRRDAAERSYFRYVLFVLFFPQLVAGPIERSRHLLHQFRETHVFEYQRAVDGIRLMAWGMFKKVVIADRLAVFVDQVYAHPQQFAGPSLALATVLFALQIYCDFSGYSDIAVGAARILGFDLMRNFNNPYAARSMHEFWQRWHISLSTWFRDYVYIPLGGNRVSEPRRYFNVLATFVLSGLWHGASWSFVVWGLLNGLYVSCSSLTSAWRMRIATVIGLAKIPRLHDAWRVIVTFTLTCIAWVFFRARDMSDALYILTHAWVGAGAWLHALVSPYSPYAEHALFLEGSRIEMTYACIAVLCMFLVERHGSFNEFVARQSRVARWVVYLSVCVAIVVFGVFGERQFIYFTF